MGTYMSPLIFNQMMRLIVVLKQICNFHLIHYTLNLITFISVGMISFGKHG